MMDVDNDGDKDILTNYYLTNDDEASNIWWFENINGLGNFNDQQILIDDINWADVVNLKSGDFNNDGKVDFVRAVRWHDNGVMWFENLGELGNTVSGNI